MPIYTPRVDASNFANRNSTSDAINSITSVFQNNMTNSDAFRERELQDLQIQQARSTLDANQAKAQAEVDNGLAIDNQITTLTDIFSPNLPDLPVAGAEGPSRPGMTVDEKLAMPENIKALNKAQFDLALKRGIKPQDVSNLLRSVAAQNKLKNDSLQNFFIGAGGKLGPNDALTVDRQNEIRADNQANLIARDAAKTGLKGGDISSSTFADYASGKADFAPMPALLYGETIMGNLENSTGVGSAISNHAANIAGLLGVEAYPEVVRARQAAATFDTRLSAALRVSPRFTEGERKDLKKIIAISPDIFNSPLVAKNKIYAIDEALENLERKAANDLDDKLISDSDKSSQASNLRAIREARRELGASYSKEGRRDDNQLKGNGMNPPSDQTGGDVPDGIDPSEWEFLTPEERAAW